MPQAVLPEHRPTLGDLLSPRMGARVLRVLAIVAAVALAAFVISKIVPERAGPRIVQRDGPVQFNFADVKGLERVEPQGDELVRMEARRGDLFIQSFAVEPFELPPYRGEPTGALPVAAAREIESLRDRFAEFELVQDGKTRVNEVSGHVILFRARLGKRRLYGREILVTEPVPGARRGVRLVMLATPAGGVSRASEVGIRGIIKRPYRTFRFGDGT